MAKPFTFLQKTDTIARKAAQQRCYIPQKTTSNMVTKTVNARLLPGTLAKIHELKNLLGFKTLLDTAEFIVCEMFKSALVLEAQATRARYAEIQALATRK